MLGQPALIMDVGPETRTEYAAEPLPLVQTRGGREVGENLLDIPLRTQSGVLPLLCGEALQVFCQGGPLSLDHAP